MRTTLADVEDDTAKEVLSEYSGKHRRWLLNRLAGAPLRRRLKLLSDEHVFSRFFRDSNNQASALRLIVANRNHLAHGTVLKAKDRMTGEQFYWPSELLLYVTERDLLLGMGVDAARADSWFERDAEFEFAATSFARVFG